MSETVLLKLENVSKKFCRSLKRSLWYGMQDIGAELIGRSGRREHLRTDEFWAVDNVSFDVARGQCLGLIGPNGAGKSTLLKVLNGLVKPDIGRIVTRGRLGALIELGAGFNPILTARENIYINGSVLGLSKKEIDEKFDEIVSFAEIGEFIDTPIQNYSSGMKVRLGFSVASQLDPDILLIDEVLAVGDFQFKQKCLAKINEIRDEKAIVLVSHSMDTISRFCDRVIVLNKGSLVADSSPAEGIREYLSLMEPSDSITSAKENGDDGGLLGPFFHNDSKVLDIKHGWAKSKYEWGDLMEFDIEIHLHKKPRNLVVGIPVWNQEGKLVTAFNSDQAGFTFDENSKVLRARMQTTCRLNPGEYESVIAIQDGIEYLYRKTNDPVRVMGKERLYGSVTLAQNWTSGSN